MSSVVVGTAVLLYNPIFQGVAASMMAGEVASTFLSRLAVPVLYCISKRSDPQPIVTIPLTAGTVEERSATIH
jgi:hypothetical protein